MPLVVIKVLGKETPFNDERDSYLAIHRAGGTHHSSGFAEMPRHDHFIAEGSPVSETRTIYYFVLQYLGPTLHDVLVSSHYRRFTSKMTMAVAIQLVRRSFVRV